MVMASDRSPANAATLNTAPDLPATLDTATAQRFAQQHFQLVDLGHQARNQACRRVAEQLCRHPGGTLPNKFASPKDYKAMDRLMNRPEVTHDSVLQPHYQRTRQLLANGDPVVLLLHDTTELDYSGLRTVQDLGPIGNSSRSGYLCHNTLAVLPKQREVLGLAQQILHRRQPVPPGETAPQKRERASRESRLWSRAVQALGAAEGLPIVDVADRGADIFEFLATEENVGRACLVRATHSRSILIGHTTETNQSGKRFDHLRSLPASGSQQTKKVRDETLGVERSATLQIGYAAVRLCPPRHRRGEYEERPLVVWGIRVWEPQPPENGTAVEWFLLSNQPVESTAAAWEKSDWYGCRPIIEEYHKCMKTGCQIEDLQFETSQSLQPMIGLRSVVAIMLLQLREAFRRPDAATQPATMLVDPIYEEVLREWRSSGRATVLSVQEFYLAVGRLGGHMNRKRDGAPGWLVLWRGWMKLQIMVTGVEAERRRQKKLLRELENRGET